MIRRQRALLGALATVGVLVAAAGCLTPSRDTEVEIQIDTGTVRGVSDDGVRSWRGIPYAAAPVGDLRWRAPQPAQSWSGVRDAGDFGEVCPQQGGDPEEDGSSEDCLFVNVFRPDTDAEDLPVMVWFHGGALTDGSGDLPRDLVAGLVDEDVVLVSLNYRLGRLGYFAHPALEAEADGEGRVGNFGLLDQVAALEWVQDNIAEFGGDPDRVTIFGISAGGASVNYLMSSPVARGLFDRAIAGSGLGREQLSTWDDATAEGEALAAGLGAPKADADALRDLDARAIADLDASLLRNQVPIQEDALPASVAATFDEGREAEVPYLVGTTDVELLDVNYDTFGVDPVALRQQLVAGHESEALSAYGDVEEFDRHFLNDLVFTEPARHLAAAHSTRAPTYRYRFSIASDSYREQFGGAVHGADYAYVFGDGDSRAAIDGKVDHAEELSEAVSECWAAFATTGEPDCAGVEWPAADDGAFVDLTNEGPVVVVDDPWQPRLDLVEAIYAAAAAAP